MITRKEKKEFNSKTAYKSHDVVSFERTKIHMGNRQGDERKNKVLIVSCWKGQVPLFISKPKTNPFSIYKE
jgi:hypothetical protein